MTGFEAHELMEPLGILADDSGLDRESVGFVRAPGRVNLIGDHIDYNEGLAMPAAIGLENLIAYLPVEDRRVELTLLATGSCLGFDLDSIGPPRGGWIDYVAATAWALQRAGIPVSGFRAVLGGDLPIGAGLSSSAALELAVAWVLARESAPAMDRIELARIAQEGENGYVGVQCGIMDQFAVAAGQRGCALLLDCQTIEWSTVPIPDEFSLVVCHTGVTRSLATSEYNARRAECQRALSEIQKHEQGIRSLRDVDEGKLDRFERSLDGVALARARHVVTENRRVSAAAIALTDGDLESVGRIFGESHASLRDDFEVSSAELDLLVETAMAVPGVVASRMTGAGFGGCTVNLVVGDGIEQLTDEVMNDYAAKTRRSPRVWKVDAMDRGQQPESIVVG